MDTNNIVEWDGHYVDKAINSSRREGNVQVKFTLEKATKI
jgi:hypothetical protein